ncbi:esterase/lipase family protein [Sorangium sp. So ce1099]|uniref:esterase/lipase family protein n=1 Tax=Sorangium sp. So ce1099 TaxID=3133331 RepID=UPI003F621895
MPRPGDENGTFLRVQKTRVYLSPGMFGFATLASLDYFEHFTRAIEERFRDRGRAVEIRVCEVHPTASILRRAAKLARLVDESAGDDDGPIHIIGHSTGGLDARLVASPTVRLPGNAHCRLGWTSRLRSVTTINTPHFGTPLAAFFATVSGQRLLYAVTALTVAGLKLGAPPLAAASALVAAFGRAQLGFLEIELIDRAIESFIRVLDDASSRELRAWLKLLRDDQGAIVQLMPEAMDLLHAGLQDRVGLRYQSVATYAPRNAVRDWVSALRSPWGAMSAAIFTALSNITARLNEHYPCRSHDGSIEQKLARVLGELPPPDANDGVVPLASQVWGELIWAGKADHLDIVGHFPGKGGHIDWLASGARFNRLRFDAVLDRIVTGMVAGEQSSVAEQAAAPPRPVIETLAPERGDVEQAAAAASAIGAPPAGEPAA